MKLRNYFQRVKASAPVRDSEEDHLHRTWVINQRKQGAGSKPGISVLVLRGVAQELKEQAWICSAYYSIMAPIWPYLFLFLPFLSVRTVHVDGRPIPQTVAGMRTREIKIATCVFPSTSLRLSGR